MNKIIEETIINNYFLDKGILRSILDSEISLSNIFLNEELHELIVSPKSILFNLEKFINSNIQNTDKELFSGYY